MAPPTTPRPLSLLHATPGLPAMLAGVGLLAWLSNTVLPGIALLIAAAGLLALQALRHRSPHFAACMALTHAQKTGRACGVLMIELDSLETGLTPDPVRTQIHNCMQRRLHTTLLPDEQLFGLGNGRFAIVLSAHRDLGLEHAIQMCGQIQHDVGGPIVTPQGRGFPTICIGLCLSSRIATPTAATLIAGARTALDEARQHAPAAIRSYSDLMQGRITARARMALQLTRAFENEEIRAHFQPQICTRTGALTGLEALARWHHPERGLIPPAEFMPALERAGLMNRLGAHMIEQSLKAMSHWDRRGIRIPRIGVNFASDELRDPSLVEKVAFELDRHQLDGSRLAVEVLETVVADRTDDIICTNLAGLAELGCCIDLDDFGTGHASITNVRRFSIQRIKIDRSFICGIDHNVEQQNMVSAILTMAERLQLETLAEGVETEAERHTLGALKCGHLQGFAIARPMSAEDCEAWLKRRSAHTAPGVAELPLRAV